MNTYSKETDVSRTNISIHYLIKSIYAKVGTICECNHTRKKVLQKPSHMHNLVDEQTKAHVCIVNE